MVSLQSYVSLIASTMIYCDMPTTRAIILSFVIYCYSSILVESLESIVRDRYNSNIYDHLRVEVIVMLFDRIVDLENFELILMVLNAREHAAIRARIGILNIFNPCKPDGYHVYNMSFWEERQVVKMLVHLPVCEPGDNCK